MRREAPEWSVRQTALVPIWGLLVVGVLDLAMGFILRDDRPGGGVEWLILVIHTLARSAIVGLGFAAYGIVAAAVGRAGRRASPGGLSLTFWLWAIPIIVAVLRFGDSMSKGDAIVGSARGTALRWGWRLGGPLLILGAIMTWRHLVSAPAISRRSRLLRMFGFCALAVTVMAVNITVHPDRYLDLHTILAMVAAASICGGTAVALRDRDLRRRVVVGTIAVAALAILAGVQVRGEPRFERAHAVERRLAPVTAESSWLVDRILGWLKPTSPPKGRSIAGPPPVDAAAVARALDAAIPTRRNLDVLWIAIDTLRHDHTGFTPAIRPGGMRETYRRNDTTPHLNELARKSFVFSRAYSPYPTSMYAFSSVLTGLYPRATPKYAQAFGRNWRFPASQSVAGALRAAGWWTVGLPAFSTANARNPRMFGTMADGFEVYAPNAAARPLTARESADLALKAIEASKDRRLFLFVHFFGPHSPYPDAEDAVLFGGDAPTAVDGYDSDIREADEQIGRIVEDLKKRHRLDRTAIFVFADHGESFGEHGATRHNGNLFEQQVHVPLLVWIPGLTGRTIDDPVSLVDLVPTTLSLVGVKDSAPRHGRDLMERMMVLRRPVRGIYAEKFFFRGGRVAEELRAVVRGRFKLIQHVQPTGNSYRMFDVLADPSERENLFGLAEHRLDQETMVGVLRRSFEIAARTHARGAGGESAPGEEWRSECQRRVNAVLETESEDVVRKLRELLFDDLGDFDPKASALLTSAERDRLAEDLEQRVSGVSSVGLRAEIIDLIASLARPRSIPFLRAIYRRATGPEKDMAAHGLARMHQREVISYLETIRARREGDGRLQAWVDSALAGDPAAAEHLFTMLVIPETRWVVAALRALLHLRPRDLAARIREPAMSGRWRERAVREQLYEIAALDARSPDAIHILLALLDSKEETLRRRCRETLADSMSDDDVTRNLRAMESWRRARAEMSRRRWAEALEAMDRADRLATRPFSAFMFRRIQILRAAGKWNEAKEWAAALKAGARSRYDRKLAAALLDSINRYEVVFGKEDRFRLALVEPRVMAAPGASRRGGWFDLDATIENTGKAGLIGGWIDFSVAIILVGLDSDGRPVGPAGGPMNHLPPTGLAPGGRLQMNLMGSWRGAAVRALDVRLLIPRGIADFDAISIGRIDVRE